VQTEFQLLLVASADRGNSEQLQIELNEAQNELDDANENVLSTFTKSVFEAAKIAYRIYLEQNGIPPPDDLNDSLVTQAAVNEEIAKLTGNQSASLEYDNFNKINDFKKNQLECRRDSRRQAENLQKL